MALDITPGAGAKLSTLVTASSVHVQNVVVSGAPRIPIPAATQWHVASTNAVGSLSAPASANLALIRMDQTPGGWLRWSCATQPNGSVGILLAGGTYPEALELVGTNMLGTFKYIAPAGETAVAKFSIEYFRVGDIV